MSDSLRKKFITGQFDIIKKYVNYDDLLNLVKDMKYLSTKVLENDISASSDTKYDELLNRLIDLGLYFFKDLILYAVSNNKMNKHEIEQQFIEMLLIHEQPYKLEPFNEILFKYPNVELDVTKSTHFRKNNSSCIDIYSMRSQNRGILFLVNNIHFFDHKWHKRDGAQFDKFYLISLYRAMGFQVFYFENLTESDFLSYINQLIEYHLDEVDCLVLAILTHGKGSNEAIFYDGKGIIIKRILSWFNDTTCLALQGKPKIFLFPFCRGDHVDVGTYLQGDGMLRNTFSGSDIIICYGSVDGFQTMRDIGQGSWFVQIYCKILAAQSHEKDFETMLYDIKKTVMSLRPKNAISFERYLQTPSVVTIDFNKILYFNPGYFENDV